MMPAQTDNADYITQQTYKIMRHEQHIQELEYLVKGLVLVAMDDKGRVRVNKQILNRIPKMQSLEFKENSAGAVIFAATMEDAKPKAKAKPKPKPKAKK